MNKLRASGIIIFLTAAGFFLIWLLEYMLADFVTGGLPKDGFLYTLYPALRLKMDIWGTQSLMEILASVKFRFLVLAGFGYYLFANSALVADADFSEKKAVWLVKLFFILQLLFVPDLLNELRLRAQWQALFQPSGLSVLWLGDFPSYAVFQFLAILLFGISAWLVLARWDAGSVYPFLAALGTLLIWTFLLSVFFGFGKTDHTYASMFSGMAGMVVFLHIWRSNPAEIGFGFRIFQAFIWCCYFFSGLEKVFLSGFDWAGSDHLQVLAALHPGYAADWISQIPFSGILLGLGLIFQLSSVLQWRFPNWGYINVAGGVLFHFGTFFLLGIGGYFSPWLAMLIFLWPQQGRR